MIEFSTVPRGDYRSHMKLWKADDAPAWNKAASGYRDKESFYCAEDGTLFAEEERMTDRNEDMTCGYCQLNETESVS